MRRTFRCYSTQTNGSLHRQPREENFGNTYYLVHDLRFVEGYSDVGGGEWGKKVFTGEGESRKCLQLEGAKKPIINHGGVKWTEELVGGYLLSGHGVYLLFTVSRTSAFVKGVKCEGGLARGFVLKASDLL